LRASAYISGMIYNIKLPRSISRFMVIVCQRVSAAREDEVFSSNRIIWRLPAVVESRGRGWYVVRCSPVLSEPNGGRLFTEALTAEVKTVFADETSLVGTETALTATLSIFTGTREPNGVVGHFF